MSEGLETWTVDFILVKGMIAFLQFGGKFGVITFGFGGNFRNTCWEEFKLVEEQK